MKQVGYLLNKKESLEGERGIFYDYILAGNGLYIHASNAHIDATVLVAAAQVRGLAPLEEKVTLLHGKIPWRLYELAYSLFMTDPRRERYVAVSYQDGYHLRVPDQDRDQASVTYFTESDVVMDIHSHGTMTAWFSGIDNRDEQVLRLYMVVGRLDMLSPEIDLRVGVYGYFSYRETREFFGV